MSRGPTGVRRCQARTERGVAGRHGKVGRSERACRRNPGRDDRRVRGLVASCAALCAARIGDEDGA
jgi:hypothetical protein